MSFSQYFLKAYLFLLFLPISQRFSKRKLFYAFTTVLEGQSQGAHFLGLDKKALLTSQYAPPPTQEVKLWKTMLGFAIIQQQVNIQ